MEKNLNVNGRVYNFAATYDGDSQYHVEVRSGQKIITAYSIAADKEEHAFEKAAAQMKANIEMGNLNV